MTAFSLSIAAILGFIVRPYVCGFVGAALDDLRRWLGGTTP